MAVCMPRALLLLGLNYLLTTAEAAPVISFPFNSQLPLVARIDEPFSFTLSPQTFTSPFAFNYSLASDTPSWLSIEPDTGTLRGVPTQDGVVFGDVVGIPIEIIATDADGSTAMSSVVVVSRNPTPSVRIPLEQQIDGFGNYSAPSRLLSYPSTDFAFTFDPDTFTSHPPNSGLNYYASSIDGSPLPSWIYLNPATLSFTGRTPPRESLVQPPEVFGFQIVASDVIGFSAAKIEFSIAIAVHKLTIDKPIVEINATRGREFEYDGLLKNGGLQLDGVAVKSGELSAVISQESPDWISFYNESLVVTGTPPSDAKTVNFTMSLLDEYADVLNIQFQVFIQSTVFRESIPEIELLSGDEFSVDLSPFMENVDDVELRIKSDGDLDWLDLDQLSISGEAPTTEDDNLPFQFVLEASSESLQAVDSQTVSLVVRPQAVTSSISPTSSLSSTSFTALTTPTASEAAMIEPTSTFNTHHLVLAIVLPIVVLMLVIIILVLMCRRRKRKRRATLTTRVLAISNPLPGTLATNDSASSFSSASRVPSSTNKSLNGGLDFSHHPALTPPAFHPGLTLHTSQTLTSLTEDMPPEYLSSQPQLGNTVGAGQPRVRTSWLGRFAPLSRKPTTAGNPADVGNDANHSQPIQSMEIFNPKRFLSPLIREDPNNPSESMAADPSSIQQTPDGAYRQTDQPSTASHDYEDSPIDSQTLGLASDSDRPQDGGSADLSSPEHTNKRFTVGPSIRPVLASSSPQPPPLMPSPALPHSRNQPRSQSPDSPISRPNAVESTSQTFDMSSARGSATENGIVAADAETAATTIVPVRRVASPVLSETSSVHSLSSLDSGSRFSTRTDYIPPLSLSLMGGDDASENWRALGSSTTSLTPRPPLLPPLPPLPLPPLHSHSVLPRDSLGISYEDLVQSAPFHPDRDSISTAHGGGALLRSPQPTSPPLPLAGPSQAVATASASPSMLSPPSPLEQTRSASSLADFDFGSGTEGATASRSGQLSVAGSGKNGSADGDSYVIFL